LAQGLDLYEEALSWTPFRGVGHARAAGRAMARLHGAAEGYHAPARGSRLLVSSFSIFAGEELSPAERMDNYLRQRPRLREYAEGRDWRMDFDELFLPLYGQLEPWLPYLTPLWTHNDFHASNLMWSGDEDKAEVCGIIDFGLADRTNAVHDLATAIERNMVEWLRVAGTDGGPALADLVHLDHLDALLAGYEELHPLSYDEARALAAMLPLVHCEFALSETDYFLSILNSEEKAYLAYEGYFLGHARWFESAEGLRLRGHLGRWAESKAGVRR
jgi:Ser/Thr protein kinase RdoA (MazF antagonist)